MGDISRVERIFMRMEQSQVEAHGSGCLDPGLMWKDLVELV